LETKWYKKMRQKQIFECVNELGRLELNLIGVENDTEYHISNEVKLFYYDLSSTTRIFEIESLVKYGVF
jgi:hypothetical protein